MDNLDPKKAVGCDKISQRLLLLSSSVLVDPLKKLINHFINTSSWPTVWKSIIIVPVFKEGDDTDKTCYRPVSILTAHSKIYEKVLFDQMYKKLGTRLSSSLSGHLKGHSCCTALLKMTEDWQTSLDNRETVSTVVVDLSKAFDSVVAFYWQSSRHGASQVTH